MKLAVALLAISLSGAAFAQQACPAAPDFSAETSALYRQIQAARSEAAARPFVSQLWQLWTRAPDARAQEMLDIGMRAHSSFDFERAMTAFDALVDYCPDYAEGWNQRAFVFYRTGRFAEALADLDRALELNPTHSAAMSGKALTLARLGRILASQGVLREALKLHPWLPERAMLIEEPQDDEEI